MSKPMNPGQLAQDAVQVGVIAPEAQTQAATAIQIAKAAGLDLGISPDQLTGSRAFVLVFLVDDSESMEGSEETVITAMNAAIDELKEANQEAEGCDILCSIRRLNGGELTPFVHVNDLPRIDRNNYATHGGTPIDDRTLELFGALIAKSNELAASGRSCQTFTCLVSDGQPAPENLEARSGVQALIKGLENAKQHIISGVAIGSPAAAYFRSLGIADRWILDTSGEGGRVGFAEAIRKVSRASRSASKGAGAFQQTASGGFR